MSSPTDLLSLFGKLYSKYFAHKKSTPLAYQKQRQLPDALCAVLERVDNNGLSYLGVEALSDLARAMLSVENGQVPGAIIETGCALGGSSNQNQFPAKNADLAFVSGSLEYIYPYKWFIKQISQHCSAAIVSYCSLEKFPDKSVRHGLAWVNSLKKNQLIDLFSQYGLSLYMSVPIGNYEIFKFKKST